MAAAFLASLGFFNIFFVAILGWLGDTIGDIIFFCIGRYGLKFLQKKSVINEEKRENILHKIEILVEKNFLLSLIFIKFTPYAPMIALPYLGTNKNISFLKFTFTTALLSLPVPIIVTIIGYKISAIREWMALIPENYKIPIIIFSIILLLLFVVIVIFGIQKLQKKFLQKIDNYIEK